MKIKVKFFKDNLNKIENGFKYGLAVAFVKVNSIEDRFMSIVLGIPKDELKKIENEDLENLKQRFHKGGK